MAGELTEASLSAAMHEAFAGYVSHLLTHHREWWQEEHMDSVLGDLALIGAQVALGQLPKPAQLDFFGNALVADPGTKRRSA